MQELSDITSGLDELLRSSGQARAEEQEQEVSSSKTEGASTDPPPSEMSQLQEPLSSDKIHLSSSECMFG